MAGVGMRDQVKNYSPPWLATGTSEKYIYNLGLVIDGFLEGYEDAVKLRFPGIGDPSALKYIGEDRNMPRGLGESDEGYAARLRKAFSTWRSAGSAHAILRQILTGLQLVMLARTVSNTGVWDTILASAVPDANGDLPWTRFRARPDNWNWDSLTAAWFRAWVILYPPSAFCSPGPAWGSGIVWGDTNRTWGLTATVEQVQTVRAIALQWRPQHAVIPWIILSFDSTLFDPTAPVGSPLLPDGTWGPWSKDVAGVRVASRNDNARYVDGVI